MKLFGYWRSSATYRVRIALALKGLDYDYAPVNLLKGEQKTDAYRAKNPTGLVPTLATNDGAMLNQSLAIMEYLEETHPEPSILAGNAASKANIRAIAATIACEAQPLMNLRIQQYLKNEGGFDDDAVSAWLKTWPANAMSAVEEMLSRSAGDFCVGDTPSMADCCLVPQMFAAERFGIDTSSFSKMNAVYERCQQHPAFEKAHPLNQPDAPEQ